MNLSTGWIRIPCDCIAYDVTGNPIGKLRKTYGVRILEIGREYVKVFSPDMNKSVFLRKPDVWTAIESSVEGE